MPALVTHMMLARRAARLLGVETLADARGAYLLGSTCPDARVLLRRSREETHFFNLDVYAPQDSVAEFFASHPRLRDAGALSPETRAWVAGYLTHLVMDEHYIDTIYRPLFGPHSPRGGDGYANLLDRVLQYEFDRQERALQAEMARLRTDLRAAAVDIDAGFISREVLFQWREASVGMTEHPPDWSAFPRLASRHLPAAGFHTPEAQAEILERAPDLLEEIRRSVPAARLRAYYEESQERVVAALKEYLACP